MVKRSLRQGVVIAPGGNDLYSPGKPRRSVGQKLLLSVGIVSTFVLLVSAGGLFWANQVLGGVQTIPVDSLAASAGGTSNWLLVGTDSRDGIDANDPNSGAFLDGSDLGGRRTDTIMVARVNTENSTIRLLSVPRDLWVDIAGNPEKGRINGAFNSEDGAARLVETVQQNLGIQIHQYAEVNFVGFQDVIDALDGVPMYFDTPMRDPKTGLNITTAGCHVLDGPQALAFARTRNLEFFEGGRWQTDPSGDLGRSTRQRYFLTRVADTTASKANVFDANEFSRVAESAGKNLRISSGTATIDLLNLARAFRAVGSEGIETYSLPVVDARKGNAAVLELQPEPAQTILALFRNSEELPAGAAAKSSFSVNVLNGSGKLGQAGLASDGLTSQGFAIGTIGDAGIETATTIVRYGPGQEAEAKTVAIYINNDFSYQLDQSISGVTLITGSNFEGIRSELRDVDQPPGAAETPPSDTTQSPADAQVVVDEAGVVPAEEDPASKCGS